MTHCTVGRIVPPVAVDVEAFVAARMAPYYEHADWDLEANRILARDPAYRLVIVDAHI